MLVGFAADDLIGKAWQGKARPGLASMLNQAHQSWLQGTAAAPILNKASCRNEQLNGLGWQWESSEQHAACKCPAA